MYIFIERDISKNVTLHKIHQLSINCTTVHAHARVSVHVCVYGICTWLHTVVTRPDSPLQGARPGATFICCSPLDAAPRPDRVARLLPRNLTQLPRPPWTSRGPTGDTLNTVA